MLETHSRWALHMELIIKPLPDEAPNPRVEDYLGGILGMIDNNEAVHITEKQTKALRAKDYFIDDEDGFLVLLLNYADVNLSDPAFEHLETGSIRVEEKRDGEGIAVSTHLAIDLRSRTPGFAAHRVVLEDVTGIGRTKLQPFLTYLFRKLPSLQFALEDGKVRNFRGVAELHGFQSTTLQQDLASGVLSGIELVQVVADGGEFDEEGLLREERRTIKIDVEKRLTGDDAVEAINRLTGKARNLGYGNMRVTWRRDEGRQKSRDFGTHREDVSDLLTLGTTHLVYDEERAQCEEKVREDVACKLIDILKEQRQ